MPSDALLDLFSRTSDAMVAINSLSRIVAWNPAATELFGHAPDEVLGKCCADVLGWRDRHGNLVCGPDCAIRQQAARELAGETQNVLATTKTGQAVWITVSSLVLPREHHRVCRVVHFIREVAFTPSEEGAVRFVHDDHRRHGLLQTLTPREHEVLDLLTIGATSAEVGTRLGISVITVQNHVAHILAKLKVRSRLEAVALALRAGERPTGGTDAGESRQ
jgi:PAS domain S-box-containing protein